MKKYILLIITLSFLLTSSVYAEDNFFPIDSVGKRAHNWYSGHLKLMDEDSLLNNLSNNDKTTYRYLFISVLADPLCIKIEIEKDLRGQVTVIKLRRPSLNQVKYTKEITNFTLSSKQTKQFLSIFDEKAFWQFNPEQSSIRLGGVQKMIEGVKDGKYHIIELWAPEETDYPQAVQVLLDLMKNN